MRILVITNTIPYPPVSGGAARTYNLLRRIAKRHDVWLATNLETRDQLQGVPHLQQFCRQVATGLMERRRPVEHLPGLMRYALAGWPLELKFRHAAELAAGIQRFLSEVTFDIVQIEESRMALYLELFPKGDRSRRILTFYDVAFAQAARLAWLKQSRMMKWRMLIYSRMMRRWEPRYAGRFDRCITVSEADRRLLTAANPCLRVDVVPNGVDTHVYQPLPPLDGLPAVLFIGNMSYAPCMDGALYLVNEILPRIRRSVPTVQAWIVGSDPSPEVLRLNGDGVHVTGRVPDVRPYYSRSTVCAVPLQAGGGTRLKILEAMALGRPVVSTSIGCEGLHVVDGEHVLIADDPDLFAQQAVRLLRDQGLYARIAASSRRLVVSQYDWDAIADRMMQVYDELAPPARAQAPGS